MLLRLLQSRHNDDHPTTCVAHCLAARSLCSGQLLNDATLPFAEGPSSPLVIDRGKRDTTGGLSISVNIPGGPACLCGEVYSSTEDGFRLLLVHQSCPGGGVPLGPACRCGPEVSRVSLAQFGQPGDEGWSRVAVIATAVIKNSSLGLWIWGLCVPRLFRGR